MAQLVKASLAMRPTSQWWYARYKIGKKERMPNLGIKIEEDRPTTVKEEGCKLFEKSRMAAQFALDAHVEKVNAPRTREQSEQAVHQARYCSKVKIHQIHELPELWKKKSRKSTPTETTIKKSVGWLETFVKWMHTHYPEIEDADFVSEEIAKEYMQVQLDRGIASKTHNDILGALNAAFKEAKSTVFDGILQRDDDTISRKPFDPEELRAILDATETDPFLRPTHQHHQAPLAVRIEREIRNALNAYIRPYS